MDNEEDLQDVAKEVLDQLEIVPVKDMEQVLALCGIAEAVRE